MSFKGMKDYKFYIVLGMITIIASILTMIITQIIKKILEKKRIIYEGMEKSKKDIILSRIGRIVALTIYTILYIAKEMYLKKEVELDGALITGLLVGATSTLLLAKSLYTILHQWVEKDNVFERLEYIEQVKTSLEEELNKLKGSKEEDNSKIKWVLTNKKGSKQNEENSIK